MAGEDDLDLLAGEYVLGTLLPDERAAVSRRLLDNPDLALRVAAGEARLAPLSEDLAPVVPRPQVWQQVKRAITEGRREARQAWWDRLALWRGWAAAATVAAVTLLAIILVNPVPTPQLVAVLNDSAGHPLWVVRASVEGNRLLARPLAEAAPVARVPELWLLPAGGQAPVSLGVLEGSSNNRRALGEPVRGLLEAGAALAVSLEPTGGSPTGQPTGPVVSSGTLVAEPL